MNLGRHNSCPPRGRHLAKRHTLLSHDTANIKPTWSLAKSVTHLCIMNHWNRFAWPMEFPGNMRKKKSTPVKKSHYPLKYVPKQLYFRLMIDVYASNLTFIFLEP